MKVRTLVHAARWALPIIGVVILIDLVFPARVALLLRFFILLTLLIRDIQGRNLHAKKVERKLDDVIFAINLDMKSRAKWREEIDTIAKLLEVENEERRVKVKDELREQTREIVGAIGESVSAAKAAHDLAGVALNAANETNTKIADLNQRIAETMAPRAQHDDIQKTVHESRDILGVIADKEITDHGV